MLEQKSFNWPNLAIASTVIGISWLPVIFFKSVVVKVAMMYPLAEAALPYFHSSNIPLLYIFLPVVVLSGIIFFLSPGLAWSLAISKHRNLAEYLFQAFIISTVSTITFTVVIKWADLSDHLSTIYFVLMLFYSLTGWVFLVFRLRQGQRIKQPVRTRIDRRRLYWAVVFIFIGVISLLPKLFWENFNGDGTEPYQLAASLNQYYTPAYSWEAEPRGADVKFILPMYIVNGFQHIFGQVEASARLPFLLFLYLLFMVLIMIIEDGQSRALSWVEDACILLSTATFGVVLAFNAAYNPWFADISAPAVHETLLVMLILASFYFLYQKRFLLYSLCFFLGYFVRPTTSFITFLFVGFSFFLAAEDRWKRVVVLMAVFVFATVIASIIQNHISLPASVLEYEPTGIVDRLRFVDFTRVKKLAYIIFPSGIVPFFSLWMIPRQDKWSRIYSIVTISYFLFFYIQAFSVLHHFAPIMVLPVLIFWRLYLIQSIKFQKRILPVVVLLGLLAFFVSLPRHFQISESERKLGHSVEFRFDDKNTQNDEDLLNLFFKSVWDIQKPAEEWGIEQNGIMFYARQPKQPGDTISYVLQNSKQPPPVGFALVNKSGNITAYVRNLEDWRNQMHPKLPGSFRSSLYDVQPSEIFPHLRDKKDPHLIDLKKQWKKKIQPIFRGAFN